jgi:hypothetical protein
MANAARKILSPFGDGGATSASIPSAMTSDAGFVKTWCHGRHRASLTVVAQLLVAFYPCFQILAAKPPSISESNARQVTGHCQSPQSAIREQAIHDLFRREQFAVIIDGALFHVTDAAFTRLTPVHGLVGTRRVAQLI